MKLALPPNLIGQASSSAASYESCPQTFSLSPSYVTSLDSEFTRVYEEYHKRLTAVQTTAREIITLWAELGTPDAQTDLRIIQHATDSPEQLGLRTDDLVRLEARRERLANEKSTREKKIASLHASVTELWERLGIEASEQRSFLANNRGVGLRAVNEYEDELARLNELKRRNMGLFVEEARCRLQALWDELYFSEEEMLSFSPAWSGKLLRPAFNPRFMSTFLAPPWLWVSMSNG